MTIFDYLISTLFSVNNFIVFLMVVMAFPLANSLVIEVNRVIKENDEIKRYRYFKRTLVWLMIICFPLLLGIILISTIGGSKVNNINLGLFGMLHYGAIIFLLGTSPIFISQVIRSASPINHSKKIYKAFAIIWFGLAISVSYFSLTINILSIIL